mmetsp:Transcript_72179/g.205115  ORF Transcript_72179/g.205115 Transcript_72179/m.205115 type:complete len:228 (+) Transcript_72179:416-1099(+)
MAQQGEQMNDIEASLDQTHLQTKYAGKQLDRLSWWHFTGKWGNRRRAREEIARRGPASCSRPTAKNTLEAKRKERRNDKGSSRKARIKRRMSRSRSNDDALGPVGSVGSVGLSNHSDPDNTVSSFLDQMQPIYLNSSSADAFDNDPAVDPAVREMRREALDHKAEVSSSLDQIGRSIDTLDAIATAMGAELGRQSEVMERMNTTATAAGNQSRLNATRTARFARGRH